MARILGVVLLFTAMACGGGGAQGNGADEPPQTRVESQDQYITDHGKERGPASSEAGQDEATDGPADEGSDDGTAADGSADEEQVKGTGSDQPATSDKDEGEASGAKNDSKAEAGGSKPKPDPNEKGQVTIYMRGFRNAKGNAAIALFTSPKGWPEKGKRAAFRREAPIRNGKAKIVVENVPPGEFAIALLHDEDKNKKMEKNLLGMPKEGFGFSRNPKIGMGAPSWKETALRLDPGKKVRVSIKVKYL